MPKILPAKKPFARGVTQLMYVGDAEPGPWHVLGSNPVRTMTVLGAIGLAYAALGSNKRARMIAGIGGAGAIVFAAGVGA